MREAYLPPSWRGVQAGGVQASAGQEEAEPDQTNK